MVPEVPTIHASEKERVACTVINTLKDCQIHKCFWPPFTDEKGIRQHEEASTSQQVRTTVEVKYWPVQRGARYGIGSGMKGRLRRGDQERNDAIGFRVLKIILAAVWRKYHNKNRSRYREASLEMTAVMSTVKRTRVIAVELGGANGFLTCSTGRARWWWTGGGVGRHWWGFHLMGLERLWEKHVGELSGSGHKEFCFGWSQFSWRRDIRRSFGDIKRKCQEMFAQSRPLVRSLELWRQVGTGDLYLEVLRI